MRKEVTNVCVKFNYDRLRIDKALVNFPKSDNNNNKNKNVALGCLIRVQKVTGCQLWST